MLRQGTRTSCSRVYDGASHGLNSCRAGPTALRWAGARSRPQSFAVYLYLRQAVSLGFLPHSAVPFPVFAIACPPPLQVAVPANAVAVPVTVPNCAVQDVEAWDPDEDAYVIFGGPYTLTVAQSSADPDALSLPLQVAGSVGKRLLPVV